MNSNIKWHNNFALLKSAVLCNGLKYNSFSDELARLFNPFDVKRTGNVGVHFRIGKLIVNASLSCCIDTEENMYTVNSPFELKKINNIWTLFCNEKEITAVDLIEPPSWYVKKTSNDICMGEIFLSEGESNLMGALNNKCEYFLSNQQCRFCAFDGNKKLLNPEDYAETIFTAYKENNSCTVTITAGNNYKDDRGLRNYIPYIQAIKSRFENNKIDFKRLPLQLECSPPKNLKDLKNIIDMGVKSFSINIELFNNSSRKNIIPAKNRIPLAEYQQSWEYIINKNGKGSVSSAILFGIEPKESTLEGAKWLISQGVRPNVIPFKPMQGSLMSGYPVVDYIEYYETCLKIAHELHKSNIPMNKRLGCTTCGACNLEGDFIE